MVSLIESNYMGFGSGVMGGSTGIMLQNRGAYFSLDPTTRTRWRRGSRTLHTLMPGMLLRDGRAEVAFGAMGGDGQPQTMLQLVRGLADDDLDPQAVVDRPRFVAEHRSGGACRSGRSASSRMGATLATIAALEVARPIVGGACRIEARLLILSSPADPSAGGSDGSLRGRRRPTRRLGRGGGLRPLPTSNMPNSRHRGVMWCSSPRSVRNRPRCPPGVNSDASRAESAHSAHLV